MINIGPNGKPTYVPAELCTILPGQPLKVKLSTMEQTNMINFACRTAPENAKSIVESARAMLGHDNNPVLVSICDLERLAHTHLFLTVENNHLGI